MDVGIESLKPKAKKLIIDCVQSAGIDVTGWGYTKEGHPVSRPQSNGAYCYDWSFRSKDNKCLVVCIWFEELSSDGQGRIIFQSNMRRYVDSLIRELEKSTKNHKRTIKDPRITRAQHFSSTVQLAHMNMTPLNVVIVSGPIREKDVEGQDYDRAIGRELDSQLWTVESFDDENGSFVLVRGDNCPVVDINKQHCSENGYNDCCPIDGAKITDQFATEERPEIYTCNGAQWYRDPNVRRLVLNRSEGVCELTGVLGFLMANGGRYLETHHIIPLSEGGADTVENVIALTADAHRQAHFGANRDELRTRCLEIVASRMARYVDVVNHSTKQTRTVPIVGHTASCVVNRQLNAIE
ncbi:HNH endonuclease [Aeromonas allosaccharophila]|uniref:HNH endonuclease n=1 Tax=Aeromonas allosaccharophila TaxID=656 RepID=UPI003986EAD6